MIKKLTELPWASHQPIELKGNAGEAWHKRAAVDTMEEKGWSGTIDVLAGECLALIIRPSIGDYMVT